ncbi:hypothetical protein CHS0354_006161 [Potamilus streckersoni]|uniref:Uncharacterized protein n=1 Tax=Potamilus streckersoni TaxID=2493646 RepID=A0AAE0W0R6_9BIVA|nr:hypothetical protein CHS0354_006161 [Potamilus streckersoni]
MVSFLLDMSRFFVIFKVFAMIVLTMSSTATNVSAVSIIFIVCQNSDFNLLSENCPSSLSCLTFADWDIVFKHNSCSFDNLACRTINQPRDYITNLHGTCLLLNLSKVFMI